MSFNIFSYVLGDPIKAADQKAFNQASADLRAARASGNRLAATAALNMMQAAANRMRGTSRKAIANVGKVESAVAGIKKGISFGRHTIALAAGVIILIFIFKK